MAAHLDGENGFTYGLVWAPSLFLLPDVDTWQLIINTVRTIVTFLLVAPLQNTLQRADEATQHKLNAVADGLARHACADLPRRRDCRPPHHHSCGSAPLADVVQALAAELALHLDEATSTFVSTRPPPSPFR